jgi:hypothetical protein
MPRQRGRHGSPRGKTRRLDPSRQPYCEYGRATPSREEGDVQRKEEHSESVRRRKEPAHRLSPNRGMDVRVKPPDLAHWVESQRLLHDRPYLGELRTLLPSNTRLMNGREARESGVPLGSLLCWPFVRNSALDQAPRQTKRLDLDSRGLRGDLWPRPSERASRATGPRAQSSATSAF